MLERRPDLAAGVTVRLVSSFPVARNYAIVLAIRNQDLDPANPVDALREQVRRLETADYSKHACLSGSPPRHRNA
jgi:hypothetical protein